MKFHLKQLLRSYIKHHKSICVDIITPSEVTCEHDTAEMYIEEDVSRYKCDNVYHPDSCKARGHANC